MSQAELGMQLYASTFCVPPDMISQEYYIEVKNQVSTYNHVFQKLEIFKSMFVSNLYNSYVWSIQLFPKIITPIFET